MSFSVVDSDRVVMPVQTVDQSLNRRFVEMAQIGCGLARLLTKHQGLWVDEAESVDDNLTLNGLDRIDDNGDSTRSELFEGLLGVDIDTGQPATETRMGVVPADNRFWPIIPGE